MPNLCARIAVLLSAMSALTMPLKAQCITDTEIIARVAAINSHTTDSYAKKIRQLKELQAAFLKCHPTKNNAYAQILHRIGDQYSKADDVERAIFYTREAVQVNQGNGPGLEKSFLTHSYFNLGVFYKRLQLPAESHRYFGLCIRSGIPFPEKHFIVFMAYAQDAFEYFQTGDYQKSTEVAAEGLLLAERDQNELAAAPLLAQKAQSEAELDNFEEAEADVQRAIFLLEKAGTNADQLATSYSIYANLLYEKKRVTESLSYYHKAFELNKATGLLQQCSRDLLDIGSVYLNGLNQGNKALYYYNEGIKLALITGEPYQLAGLYMNSGVVYWKNKDFRNALKYYQKALNVLPLNFTDTAIKSNLSVDMLKLVANDYVVYNILANKGSALLALYHSKKDRMLLQLALNTYEIADKSVDIMRWKQSGEQSRLYWRQKTKQLYGEAIEVCYQLGNTEKAYYFFEKSRAVLLGDQLNAIIASHHISGRDQMAEKQLRTRTVALSQKLLSLAKTDKNYNVFNRQWHDAQSRWEDFIKSLESKYPVYYQYKYDNSVYSYTKAIRKLSADKQSLIEYFNGGSAVYILSLSADRQELAKLKDTAYRANAREMLALCSDKSLLNQNYDRYCKAANLLYQQLFKPLRIAGGRVIVSPDDLFIPFEALISDSRRQTSFLAKQYTFSYVHSMNVLMKNLSSEAAKHTFFGIAPERYNNNPALSPLPGSAESLQKIAAGFTSSSLLTGSGATRGQFLSNAAHYNIVQIYAHADAGLTKKEPVLYLADSAVYLSDIQKITFSNTDLAVLSACNTGVGHHAEGEGIFSLARAFTVGGVPATVTNLWQVDHQITYQITEMFYAYLQAGLPKDVALNRAKLDLMAQGDHIYDLPYFWAATVVIGNTDGIDRQSAGSLPLAVLIAAILLFSALYFFFRSSPFFNRKK